MFEPLEPRVMLAADPRVAAAANAAVHPLDVTVDRWISPTSGNWNVASNWSTGAVPGSGDTALIDTPGVTVTVNDAEAAGRLTVNATNAASPPTLLISAGSLRLGDGSSLGGTTDIAGGTLFVAGGTVTLAGATAFTAGGINLDGSTLINTGLMTWSVDSTGQIYGNSGTTGDGYSGQGGTLSNTGTIDNGAAGGPSLFDNVAITNAGTFDFTDNGTIADGSYTPSFTNTGIVEKTGGTGTATFGIAFNNQGGTIASTAGTLNLPYGTSTGGTYNAAAGATVALSGHLTGTYTGSGAGAVTLGGNIQIGSAGGDFQLPRQLVSVEQRLRQSRRRHADQCRVDDLEPEPRRQQHQLRHRRQQRHQQRQL